MPAEIVAPKLVEVVAPAGIANGHFFVDQTTGLYYQQTATGPVVANDVMNGLGQAAIVRSMGINSDTLQKQGELMDRQITMAEDQAEANKWNTGVSWAMAAAQFGVNTWAAIDDADLKRTMIDDARDYRNKEIAGTMALQDKIMALKGVEITATKEIALAQEQTKRYAIQSDNKTRIAMDKNDHMGRLFYPRDRYYGSPFSIS